MMTFPSVQKQLVVQALTALDLSERARFSAWCLCYFETDAGISDFFDKTIGVEAKARVAALAKRLRANEANIELLHDDLKFLEALDWDVDAISESDADASQGLTDYLAAATFAVKGVLVDSVSDFYACAENVINRIDYLVSSGKAELSEDLVELEHKKQRDFLALLKSGGLGG